MTEILGNYYKNARGDVLRPEQPDALGDEGDVACNFWTSEGDDMGGGAWYPKYMFENMLRVEGEELKRFLILAELKK